MPGQAKTVSATIDPVTRVPRVMPIKVRGGITAFFRACFQIIWVSDTPLALANLMYSVSRLSSMADRTMRIFAATVNQPRVMAGRMKLFQSYRPDGGTQPSITAKKKIIIMPSQNGGMDCPKRATSLPTWSQKLSRLIEERIPRGTPITRENMKAAAPSCKVAGRRSRIVSVTG